MPFDESLATPRRAFNARMVAWTALAALLLIAAFVYYLREAVHPLQYGTAEVSRGPIVRSIAATGTVNPVITVQVGSYVSGPIIALYVDFNSPVKQGQPIAKIDPRPFELKAAEARALVADSQAQLAKDQADMSYKELLYRRTEGLLAVGAVSRDIVDNYLSSYKQALSQMALDRALIDQQQASLKEAQVNINYTTIVSPVDGVVVARNVDVGQTVAASFETPTLFLIAQDLSQMQVDCSVSESDIGGVAPGDSASFAVDAFPDREFNGVVNQVRQNPITVQNVVTYDVVVDVANKDLSLKPGMTADVTIVSDKRDDALRVPLDALHFNPRGSSPRLHLNRTALAAGKPQPARLWLRHLGRLVPVTVSVGLADDKHAELLSGRLKTGDRVVTGEISPADAAAATTDLQLAN